jgi:hypothetical protein
MITQVRTRYFKRFDDQTFPLSDHIVLAGPNNSGKTTLLQAIVVWNLALQRWQADRKGKGKRRTGLPLTREDFTAIPLREMNQLWTDTLTALGKADAPQGKAGFPRVMEIELSASNRATGQAWNLTFEFRYQNTKQIYAKPADKHIDSLPPGVSEFHIVHVPPFSGIGVQETRYDQPYQDLLIGQGKPGDILRNLLLEIHQKEDKSDWDTLVHEIADVFGYHLLPPQYQGLPFILCEYVHGKSKDKGKDGRTAFDISCAGSGFHQVLMLLAFFYARPASILLLDEPDAHLHAILQKQIYDMLRSIAAKRGCQLIIATHSEVLLDDTSPERIMSFYQAPHPLVEDAERDQVREALKRLTAMDILNADDSTGILYVEGEDDFNLLRTWAKVLNHPLYEKWFAKSPFWHCNRGRNPQEARAHFFALRAIKPSIKAYLLLDGDNRDLPGHKVDAEGLVVGRWRRYEAESYLVHPDAIFRFLKPRAGELLASKGMDYLQDELPNTVLRDPLGDHDYLNRTPASKTLLPGTFKAAEDPITKDEYYLVAEQMTKEEIAPEVEEKLNQIAAALGVNT